MKLKEILVFGASGQIGRHLIRKLTKNNYKVIAVTRNYHQKAYILKTQANPGYLEIVESSIYDFEKLSNLFQKSEICINLVGVLTENKSNTFEKIHSLFPSMLAKMSKQNNLKKFIHVSALGIEKSLESSKYAKSKFEGEKLAQENFNNTTILRPSLVYSVDDSFTTRFFSLLNLLPLFPLYYGGKTKFTPIHVTDLAQIIFGVINKNIDEKIIECIGPQVFTFKEIIKILLKSLNKKRLIINLPLPIAKLMAKTIETMTPNPVFTIDQLNLLKYDNIASGIYKTNYDLNLDANLKFENEIEKYSYMWKEAGQFSKTTLNK